MAYKDVLKDIATCAALGVPGRTPVFGIGLHFNIRMAGITHRQYTNDIDAMVRCEAEAVEKFDYDWSLPFPDDFIEIEPLGVITKGQENIPRAAVGYLEASRRTISKLKLPDPSKDGRIPAFLEALKRIKAQLGDHVCLTGHVAAPFTAATLVFGVENTLMLLYNDPGLLHEATAFLTELEILWATAQIRAGADAIWVGDCCASSSFISGDHFSEYAAKPAASVIEQIRKHNAFSFYHAGDKNLSHLKLMADLGASAVNVAEGIDLSRVREVAKVCLMGNMDPIKILWNGTAQDVAAQTRKIISSAGRGGFIFNTGEGIVRQTPEENVRAMIRTVRASRLY
jgi:uroporphyrinogen decarboxylase